MTQFTALTSALSALRASQTGMDVTSHNIANANTAGYTRQRVNITTSTPYYTTVGAIGTGVKVTDIERIRDTFLDMRLHASNSNLGSLEVKADLLGRTEQVMGEPDFGVTKELNELWAAFDELSLRPDDNSVRLSAITALGTLTSRIRTVSDGLTALGEDAQLQLENGLEKVNDQIQQLADVNDEIASISATGAGVPNDLLDRRDILVDELSRGIGANATYADSGMARLSLNGFDLVSETRANTLILQSDNTLLHPSGGVVNAGGRIRGFQEYLDTDPATGVLAGVQQSLDDFATELLTQLNAQQAAGRDLDGDTGTATTTLLSMAGGASSLTVDVTRPEDLAAADPTMGAMDGSNASSLAMLRSVPAPPRVTGDPYVGSAQTITITSDGISEPITFTGAETLAAVITQINTELTAAGITTVVAENDGGALRLRETRSGTGIEFTVSSTGDAFGTDGTHSSPVVDAVLRSVVTDLGAEVASMRRQAGAEQGINNTAAAARRDHNAVSLDEEMVSLMTFQRTFEAAARVVTAVDEAMQTIVSRLGLVGR